MMASAAGACPSMERAATAVGMPDRNASMRRLTPITPVEATSTRDGEHASALAVSAAISSASDAPCGPVQALAQPLFVTIACTTPAVDCRCRCDNNTGAALAWLRVKMAAADTGRAAAITDKSGRPLALMPHAIPDARNPRGAVMPPSIAETAGARSVVMVNHEAKRAVRSSRAAARSVRLTAAPPRADHIAGTWGTPGSRGQPSRAPTRGARSSNPAARSSPRHA